MKSQVKILNAFAALTVTSGVVALVTGLSAAWMALVVSALVSSMLLMNIDRHERSKKKNCD